MRGLTLRELSVRHGKDGETKWGELPKHLNHDYDLTTSTLDSFLGLTRGILGATLNFRVGKMSEQRALNDEHKQPQLTATFHAQNGHRKPPSRYHCED